MDFIIRRSNCYDIIRPRSWYYLLVIITIFLVIVRLRVVNILNAGNLLTDESFLDGTTPARGERNNLITHPAVVFYHNV